jgi:hypothetical protein
MDSPNSPPPPFVALKDAARLLGESTENTRLRLKSGILSGEQRGRQRRWFVDSNALATLARVLGRGPGALLTLGDLAEQLRLLRADVDALMRAPSAEGRDLERVEHERDTYRAEASTMREIAARTNAAQHASISAFRQILEALEEQSAALGEAIGPRTPGDLGL